MVTSRSYTITLAPEKRDELLERVRHLLEIQPDLAGAERVAVPCSTRCSLAQHR